MIKDDLQTKTYKKLAVAFSGPSNSGKTTLIVKIANILQDRGYKTVIVKHDPKDKARFDQAGKDSDKFSQTGSDVAVVSPNRTTLFKQSTSTVDEIISLFGTFDFLLVEGLKTLPFQEFQFLETRLMNHISQFQMPLLVMKASIKMRYPKSWNN